METQKKKEQKSIASEGFVKALSEYSKLLEEFTKATLNYVVSLQKLWADSMVSMADIYGVSMKPFSGADVFKTWTDPSSTEIQTIW